MKKDMVGSVPGNVLGMMADLAHKLQHGVIVPEELEKFLKKENPFETKHLDLILDWQTFYRDVFGIKADFSDLCISKKPKGFGRLIIVVQGMTPQRLYDKCREMFACWRWTDELLDGVVISDRNAKNGAYAIWVRDRIEADEELKNLSANSLEEKGIVGITLEERLLYELKYFKESTVPRHLDIQNVTLCSGSRYDDGDVPLVDWLGGRMSVDWYDVGYANSSLCSRQVVS